MQRLETAAEWLFRIIAVILSLFSDARTVLHAVLFLILIDQVMGITYAIKCNKFNWRAFNKVYIKIIIYIAAILAAFVYERYLLVSDNIYFTQIIAALVGFQELSSSFTKFTKMTGIKVFETILEKIKG